VRDVLASTPPGAVLFSVGDVLYDGITYRTVCERERPDLVFVDEYLLTRPWYVADLRRRHPGVLPPFDHYTGDGATVSRRWIEHLRGQRPVAFTGFLDRSWGPDWVMIRRGLVWVPYRADSTPSAVERVRTSVALLDSLRLESFARGQDPAGPEAESRPRVSEFVAATCLQLCDPDGRALRLADHRGLASLAALLTRLEDEPALADPPLLRAMGLVRVFHPDFLDRARAARDLAAYLAAGPQGPEAADAARVLDQVRRGGP
jgi:hypothetical protein